MEAFSSGKPLTIHEVATHLRTVNQGLNETPKSISELWKEHEGIRRVINIATKAQKEFGGQTNEDLLDLMAPSTVADVKVFNAWAKKHKIYLNKDVNLASDHQGLALKANKPISSGELLVKVPRDVMLTSETARQSDMLKNVVAYSNNPLWQLDNVVLAVYLCCQKVVYRSFWEPYIKMLPGSFDLPIFFSLEQLKNLTPSPLFEETLSLYRCLFRQYCVIFDEVYEKDIKCKNLKNNHMLHHVQKAKYGAMTWHKSPAMLKETPLSIRNFTFDQYLWATSCVSTRMFWVPRQDWNRIPKGASTYIPALVPLLDLVSREYKPDYVGDVAFTDNLAAEVVAYRDFTIDEVTPILFGGRSNIDLLLRNPGFVPEFNPHDKYRLRLRILPYDPNYEEKIQRFETLGFRRPKEDLYTFYIGTGERPIPPVLLSAAKIIVSSGEDFESSELEKTAVTMLKGRFKYLRCQYAKTPGMDDHEHIKDMIEKIRRSEVALLKNAEIFCAKREEELEAKSTGDAADAGSAAPRAEDSATKAGGSEAPPPEAGVLDASGANDDAPKTSEAAAE